MTVTLMEAEAGGLLKAKASLGSVSSGQRGLQSESLFPKDGT